MSDAFILPFSIATTASDEYRFIFAAALGMITLYFIYKVFYRRDFGVPVRRRLLQLHMRVERDQIAFVPFWWSDMQIQHAIRSHWRESLRQGFRSISHS